MEHEKLIREEKSGAILNTDQAGLRAYKKRRQINKEKDERIADLEEKVEFLMSMFESKN